MDKMKGLKQAKIVGCGKAQPFDTIGIIPDKVPHPARALKCLSF
jgi:hypothetical protein